ncbi:MAG: hypothetical protein ABSA48_07730 [Terracidiphilus sp.]|jgi:hypothetical protein
MMRFRVNLVVVAALFLLLNAGRSAQGQASSASVVAGTYHITGVTSINPHEVKLSLQLRLANRSTSGITLTNLVFHSAHPVAGQPNSAPMRLQPIASSLDLKANTAAKLTQDVVTSRQEYLEFTHGRPLHFQATVQNADGTTRTLMLGLRDNPLMGGN